MLNLRGMRTGLHGPLHPKCAGEVMPEQCALTPPTEQVAEMPHLISTGKVGTDFF